MNVTRYAWGSRMGHWGIAESLVLAYRWLAEQFGLPERAWAM